MVRGISPRATAAAWDESQIYGTERWLPHALEAQTIAIRHDALDTAKQADTRAEAAFDGELDVTLLGGKRGGAPDPGTDKPDIGRIRQR